MRSKATSYTYDKAGNRLTETVTYGTEAIVTSYKYNEQNRLEWTLTQSDGISEKTQYQYDSNGNMVSSVVSRVVSEDIQEPEELELFKQGTKANSNVTIYEYDLWNRLTWSLSSGKIMEYEYNGEGRRTEKTVDGETTRYLYEYDKVVLEVDGNNAQEARNVYGINLIARSAESTTLYYMYNGHADVVALLDISCIILAQYYYDAFGNIQEQSGTAQNPIRYAGYQYDEETGLYYLNARYYDSKIARFISEDTYRGDANDPLSLNLYTYCHNEPVMYWDPSGHWEQGDEYLNDNAKAAIIALTNAYYEATTDFERGAIHSQADAIRRNKDNYTTKVTPLSLESYDAIYDAVDSGVAARGYMTKEEWVDAVYSVGVTYATKTQYNGDSYSVKKETNTVTSIGRSDLTVNINSDSKYRTAYTRIGLTYNLTPNEQKFVESTSYNPAESVCILDVMNKNKGEITESELENIVGDNYHKTRWWGKILPGLDPSTADILEMQYKFTNKGFSIEQLSYMRFSEKFNETLAAFYIDSMYWAMSDLYSSTHPDYYSARTRITNPQTAAEWIEYQGTTGPSKGAAPKVYNAGGDPALRATRRPVFDNMMKNGVEVNGNSFKLNEHAYNSMFKSGRKDIMPVDVIDALATKPQAAQPGSVQYINPSTGTTVFINPTSKEIVGIWPAGFGK